MNIHPHRTALLALIALVPAASFAVVRSDPLVAVAMINVVIITISLYIATTPANEHTASVAT